MLYKTKSKITKLTNCLGDAINSRATAAAPKRQLKARARELLSSINDTRYPTRDPIDRVWIRHSSANVN